MSVATALAPDPVLARRDDLLDADAVRTRLTELLGVEVKSCECVRATYHPLKSLRLLLRVEHGNATTWIAARTFGPGLSAGRYARTRPGLGTAVLHAPDLETLFILFPADRKLSALPQLMRLEWPRIRNEASSWCRIVGYAPERAATVAVGGDDGATTAYVKLLAGGAAARTAAAHRTLRRRGIHCADALATWPRLGAVALEPLDGDPLTERDDLRSWHAFGLELARLHVTRPIEGRRATRLEPAALDVAASTIARARPDVAAPARLLVHALRRSAPGPAPDVCLHGDPHPKNVLVDDAGAQLLDLDDLTAGGAAIDLGSVLAGLRCDVLLGRRDPAAAAAFLEGYGERAPLPDAHALHWHTAAALLAERSLRAITRLRADALARLDALLTAGLEELA